MIKTHGSSDQQSTNSNMIECCYFNTDKIHRSITHRIFKNEAQRIFVKRRFLSDMDIRKEDEFCLLMTMRNKLFESEVTLFSDSLYSWLDTEQIPQEKKEEIIDIICNCYDHKSSKLDLSGFGLTSLPPIPEHVCYLFLSNNKLSEMPILPEKIVYLDLRHNMIVAVNVDYLNSLQYLETLDLSSNQLTEFPEMSNNIVILNCKENPISKNPLVLKSQLSRMRYCGLKFHKINIGESADKPEEILDLSLHYSSEKDKDILFSDSLKNKAKKVRRFGAHCYVIDAPCPTELQKKQCVYRLSVIKLIKKGELPLTIVQNEVDVSQRVSDLNLNRYFTCNGHDCLVMNNLGVDLLRYLMFLKNQDLKISIEDVRVLFRDLLDQLIEMEKYGIYHNDIKPENILIDQIGKCHFIDFAASNGLLENFVRCQSKYYKPPEYNAMDPYDSAKKDAYSLGITMSLFKDLLKEDNNKTRRFSFLISNLINPNYRNRYTFQKARSDEFFNEEEMKDKSLQDLSLEHTALYKKWRAALKKSLNKTFFEKNMEEINFWMTYKEVNNQVKKHKKYLSVINDFIQYGENKKTILSHVVRYDELKKNCISMLSSERKLSKEIFDKAKKILPHLEKEIDAFSGIGSELTDSSSREDFKKTQEELSVYLKQFYDIKEKKLIPFIKSEEEDIIMMQKSSFYNK